MARCNSQIDSAAVLTGSFGLASKWSDSHYIINTLPPSSPLSCSHLPYFMGLAPFGCLSLSCFYNLPPMSFFFSHCMEKEKSILFSIYCLASVTVSELPPLVVDIFFFLLTFESIRVLLKKHMTGPQTKRG